MTKAEQINTWRKIVEKQDASGISAGEFCRVERLNFKQFHLWRRRFR
jgi:hypothetical protein